MLTPDEVTIAALANVVRMLCEELVAGQHSNNIDIIDECAARSRLNVAVNGATPEVLATGLKRAFDVLTPVLASVRAQVAVARENDAAQAAQNAEKSPKPSVKGSHLIN
jgi:hypothetical protein